MSTVGAEKSVMATIVIPNCMQIAVEATCSGQPVVNVLHFRYPEGTFIAVADTLAAFKTAWEATGGPLKVKTSATVMVGYKLTDLSSLTGATGYLSSTATGQLSGALSTMASSALVKLGGGSRSRSGAGRIYHGPLAETDINPDGRSIAPASATAITNAYNQVKTAMALQNCTMVVASRKRLTTSDVGNLSVSSIIATQRRRLR